LNRACLLILTLVFLSGFLSSCQFMQPPTPAPTVPAHLLSAVPPACSQLVLVQAPELTSIHGSLWLLKRDASGWQTSVGPKPVSLGRKGLAWGIGEHSPPPPHAAPLKQEGDQRSPLGVFELPFAFGSSADSPTQLPYQPMTPYHAGVDDPQSRFYNQIVDARQVDRDWSSAESMLPHGGSYELGLFVAHNPQNLPGSGSCIFMHLWLRPHEPTSGCTAMSKETMRLLLSRLRPEAHPHLVQWVATE
jgi:L,D-peptidoglycan transpeptidase YkuD (ErfK/YbiS/YcfS/YnhG family)